MFPTTAQMDDHDLVRRVRGFLTLCGVPRPTRIEVKATGGRLVLRGQVASEHDKRLCIQCCRHVAGVVSVADELRVIDKVPVLSVS